MVWPFERGLAPVAERQLAAWQAIAADWQVLMGEDMVCRCGECGKSIWLYADQAGHPYRYTTEQALSLTVLHLRNHHPDLDPDKPAQAL